MSNDRFNDANVVYESSGFGKENKESMGRKNKIHTNIRLDPEVVGAFRATGRGWQTRINSALREWLKLT